MTRDSLTARQSQILDLIRGYIADEGCPPTRAEIAIILGFRSPNAAEDHLRALQRKGYYAIKREVLEIPVVGPILRDVGGIPIKRDEQDTEALRTMRPRRSSLSTHVTSSRRTRKLRSVIVLSSR